MKLTRNSGALEGAQTNRGERNRRSCRGFHPPSEAAMAAGWKTGGGTEKKIGGWRGFGLQGRNRTLQGKYQQLLSLLTMVEDLQEIENKKNAKKRATRAKNVQVVRCSMPFTAPRRGNNAPSQ
ncbi:Uncharacterized protein Fot_52588 [Forsythia ovata]|uniref:Uncharacterized protein n=1 Tax=Forsythia ovata TaxID=205694 RepID=A0ABD1PLU2_9LAMI